MPINNDNPVTVPAKVFDQWYVTSFSTVGDDPNVSPKIVAEFRAMRRDEQGVAELAGGVRTHTIDNLWARIASDPQAAAIFTSLMDYLGADAKAAGVID